MTRLLVAWLLLLPLAVSAQTEVPAQPSAKPTLVVGVKLAPPFTMSKNGDYHGLAVELWEEVAQDHNWQFQYKEYDLQGLLRATERGEIAVGLGAITVTAEREQRMDFSHPITSSGLGIAVRNDAVSGWLAVAAALLSPAFLSVIATLAILLLLVGILAWALERKHNPEQFGGSRGKGIFSGFWWAMVTMTTVGYGDVAPRTVGGRVLGMVWMLTALLVVSFFTASITSALTVGQLSQRVQGIEDLASMRIASVPASTSAAWLEFQNFDYASVDNLDAALARLASGKVDAVVYDKPLLHWQIAQQGYGSLNVLPLVLERQDYAFALPDNSPLREAIDTSLLERINAPDWAERIAEFFDPPR